MTDQISFPSLHDLSPGEHETRKQHLLSEISREPKRRRIRVAVPAAAAVCAAAVCAVVFSGALGSSGTHRSGSTVWGSRFGPQNSGPASSGPGAVQPDTTPLGNDNPFGADGKLVTLQQFVADMVTKGYSVPLPNSPLANSDNVGNVWENTATGAVIVYYPSSGIQLDYGGTGVDYSGFPADEIQTINGVRALVLPAGSPLTYYSTVLLPIPSGHAVTLLSKGPVSDLVSVAKTMSANTAQSGGAG